MLSQFNHVQLFVTLQIAVRQVPQSIGFSRQEYWNGLTCPPPGDLPNLGIILQVDSLLDSFHWGSPFPLPIRTLISSWELQSYDLI